MSIQIQDPTTADVLATTTASEEVRGPDGRLLGRFTPVAALPGYIPEFDTTVEELDRIRTDPNTRWVTPEEVIARLREIDRCSP